MDWGKTGDVLATSGRSGTVGVWDAANLTVVKELDVAVRVVAVRATADGSRLPAATAGDYGGDRERDCRCSPSPAR